MTSSDQHIEAAPTDHVAGHTDSSLRDRGDLQATGSPAAQETSIDTEAPVEQVDSSRPDGEPASEKPLFAEDLLDSLRTRWTELQAVFVDDPRACVQKADGLVADVVGQLVTGFADARSHLERQWGRGEEASTEDLRIALKRYREFFDRLLKV
jgi:hypothetical protein